MSNISQKSKEENRNSLGTIPSLSVQDNEQIPQALQPEDSSSEISQKSHNDEVFIESNAGDGTRREDQYVKGYKLVITVISLLLTIFITAIDQTIVVTILSEIGDAFNGFDKINWLSSGFLLSVAVFTTVWGKFSIIIGRKIALSIAIVLFEIGSLICALSTSMNMLIVGRVVAGIGGGGVQSLVFIVISEIIPIEYRNFGMILLSVNFSTASVIGPLIGGLLSKISWRWCFYINLPIGGVALLFLQWAFNPPRPKGNILKKLKTIDYLGATLLCAACVLVLLGLSFGSSSQFSWDSAQVICCFVIGGIMSIAFCVWNFKYSKYPLISLDLVQSLACDASVLVITTTYSYLIMNQLYLSIYFQVILGYDGWHSGIHLLPMIISSVIASIIGGVTLRKVRIVKPFSILAAIFGLVGNTILLLLKVDSTLGQIIGLLILPGLSTGLQMQSTVMLMQLSVPKSEGSTIMGTTFFNFGRSMGGATGADLATLTYNESLKAILRKAISNETNPQILYDLSKVNLSELMVNTSLIKTLNPVTQAFIKDQVMKAIRNVYHLAAGIGALCVIFSLFQSNQRVPKKSKGADLDDDESEKGEQEQEKVVNDQEQSNDQQQTSLANNTDTEPR
ncbi:major facilitator superfamily domain-containing protein [Scheffersomyces amazonensis]|uniref:major facilitator superfamily domain-containing protein n=1 Tax=Scheffersomyces amazonensis TaxID=1078765 RepID=UPI00315CEB43